MGITDQDIVLIYNNDVHGGISADEDYSGSSKSLGYAGLAAVKEDISSLTDQVTTIDLGDAIQGSVVCTESNGQDAMDLMAKIGYDNLASPATMNLTMAWKNSSAMRKMRTQTSFPATLSIWRAAKRYWIPIRLLHMK